MSYQNIEILSGGQTGVDRAALDIALKYNIPCHGWCPKGRLAEDGPISEKYPLKETATENPEERTTLNVKETAGTLIIHDGKVDHGTAFTISQCMIQGQPMAEVDLSEPYNIAYYRDWIKKWEIRKLNIAGPRESSSPGIYERAKLFLERLIKN